MRKKFLLLCFVALCHFTGQSQTCDNWLKTPTENSYVTIGDLDIAGNQLTVEATFNRTGPLPESRYYHGNLVAKHFGVNDINYLLRPGLAELSTTAGYFETPPVCPIELNKTYHVAMVYNGAFLKFYRNGVLLSQVAATGNLKQNNWVTHIGANYFNTTTENFIGYINEVRIWNIARTEAEIQAHMNSSLPSPSTIPGLQAYYTFDSLLNKQGNPAWNGTLTRNASLNQVNPSCGTIQGCNPSTYYQDLDGDGFGNPAVKSACVCSAPAGYVNNNNDCNDNDASIYAAAVELCDNKDNDCDGQIDENVTLFKWYLDSDKDGFGDVRFRKDSCAKPSDYILDSSDCNDAQASVYPGATEVADGLDNDCDGVVDEGFATRSLKVNLYGGTNPYSNTEWNNWNVTASLSSGALKYSDASVSSISAALSKSSGINDNGTAYGSGMAPAEVLRYSSSSTTSRTLVLSGLAPSKYYSLELYASRSTNAAYTTVFTIGGASQAAGTYKNLTNKVLFSALSPSADGKLSLLVESPDAYNYLNGFVLTESSTQATNQAPTASAGGDKAITLPTNAVTLSGSGSDGDGTIQRYTWTKLSGPASFTLSSRTAAMPTLGGLAQGTYTFRLTVTDNGGATSFDDVSVTVAPEPLAPGTKQLKVNLYGGTYPYNNAEWTNWNLKASLSIAALKYSDATTSGVGAVLSSSETIYDNGTTYGGTMAPPEVLRYASGATTDRTLTLSGLSSSNTYSLELYASRNNTGNSTIFSMNDVSVVLKTDKNKSTKVLFSNLSPNAEGKLTLGIRILQHAGVE